MGGRKQPPQFEREDRYIVIKRKHLTAQQLEFLRAWLGDVNFPHFRCVVIEEDWSIYDQAWLLVENCWRTMRGLKPKPMPLDPAVTELVIAARIVAFEDQSYPAIKRLDRASEAFAELVPWENEPID